MQGRLESVSCLDGHLFTLSWFVPKPLEGSNRAGEADIEGVPYRKKAAHGDRRRGSQKTPSRQATHVHQLKKMARVIESARAAAAWSSPHEQFQWGGVHQQADTDLGMTWQHKITSILRSTTTEYVTADGEVKTVMSRKGKPGVDSVNACIPWTIERCKYASFSKYLQALDVLISSGLEVITIHDDFASYYELFALGEFDKWYSGQIVSAEGSDQ